MSARSRRSANKLLCNILFWATSGGHFPERCQNRVYHAVILQSTNFHQNLRTFTADFMHLNSVWWYAVGSNELDTCRVTDGRRQKNKHSLHFCNFSIMRNPSLGQKVDFFNEGKRDEKIISTSRATNLSGQIA